VAFRLAGLVTPRARRLIRASRFVRKGSTFLTA
jgi:hypothetical protein